MNSLSNAITTYIQALAGAREATTRSEDRLAYTKHLAAAAEMAAALDSGDHQKLLALLSAEEHNFGWSYLSGAAGEQAERAFQEFGRRIRASAGGV
jgi:hypothetical protein